MKNPVSIVTEQKMDMSGEYVIPAPRDAVWKALNDPQVLNKCIPGCETVDKISDTEFEAKVTAKVGPVRAKFSGKVKLTDVNPPNGYTISGEGNGGAAGFAKGGAKILLSDDPDGTKLAYTVDATVGGKLAQIGSRLVDSTAKKMAKEFFEKFAEIVSEEPTFRDNDNKSTNSQPSEENLMESSAIDPTAEKKGLNSVVWVGGLIVIVLIMIYIFQL